MLEFNTNEFDTIETNETGDVVIFRRDKCGDLYLKMLMLRDPKLILTSEITERQLICKRFVYTDKIVGYMTFSDIKHGRYASIYVEFLADEHEP